MKKILALPFLFCFLALPQSGRSQSPYQTLLERADSLATAGDGKQARLAYQQALVFDPQSIDAFVGLAKLARKEQNWQQAQDYFHRVLDLQPDNRVANAYFDNHPQIQVLLSEGEQHFAQDNLNKAREAFEDVLKYNKRSLPALTRLCEITYETEAWQDYREWVRQVLEFAPQAPEVQKFRSNPKLEARLSRADSLAGQRKLRDARELYEQALMIDHQSIRAFNGLGKLYRKMFDWKQSKKWFKRTLKLEPHNREANHYLLTNPKPEVIPVLNEARNYMKLGELGKAKAEYEKALEIYAGTVPAFRGLGQIAFEQQDWDAVKAWYDKLQEVQPLDLEAKYCRGVAYRETGKLSSLLIKRHQFNESQDHLDAVIAADSTYRDVLYQRALLERWRENWVEAVKLAHRQLRLKPDLPAAHVGLYKLCRFFLHHAAEPEPARGLAGAWLDFLRAERLRQSENFAGADSILDKLSESAPDLNQTLVHLTQIRLNLQLQREDEAARCFSQALSGLQTDIDAAFLFEDWKYLFTERELALYRRLGRPGEKKAFFERFWTSRNPTPAAPINVRALEHYRRLIHAEKEFWFDGVRSAANNADQAGALAFPDTYWLNGEFNDKGLVYLRYGEPDETARTPNRRISNESWLYHARFDRDKLIFHFMMDENLGIDNNWRLTASLPDPEFARDRLGWDAKIDRMALTTRQQDFQTAQYRAEDESRIQMFDAMQSDYHTWQEQFTDLSVLYAISTFRGFGRKVSVALHVAIPLHELLPADDGASLQALFEHGAGLYDKMWQQVVRDYARVQLQPGESPQVHHGFFIHEYEFLVEVGTFNIAFFARDHNHDKVGVLKGTINIPEYAPGPVDMSDILLAYDIYPDDGKSQFRKGEFAFIPNPARTYTLSEPIYLYYEVYNLSRDNDGETRFDIEVSLKQVQEKKGGLAGLLPSGEKRKKRVSLRETRTGGVNPTSVDYTSIDVSRLQEGEYELAVRITDNIAQKAVRKIVKVKLDSE